MPARIVLRRQQLTKYMTLAGMTRQKDLAEAVGISEASVYRTLEGRNPPGGKFIAGLLATFAFAGVDFNDLFEIVTH
ncbi:helix-turn-helix domain-containing protein [Rhodococcus daqingensis]|uniref:Helix-turn-helix domain-containing protein n=1 Tax=Rhodococcus daqingensis TaxID=2479363 RepID=A0ABW2RXX8_9NOCA